MSEKTAQSEYDKKTKIRLRKERDKYRQKAEKLEAMFTLFGWGVALMTFAVLLFKLFTDTS